MTDTDAAVFSVSSERLFDGDSMHGPTVVTVEHGVVTGIEPFEGEAEHQLITAGLVDLQVNGWDDVDVASADGPGIARLSELLAAEGTTHWLATVTTDSLPRLMDTVHRLGTVLSGGVHGPVGIHVEGPFLGGARGAHPREHVSEVDLDWLATLPDSVRIMTVGAEQELFGAAASVLRDKGTVVSVGHSRPTREDYEKAVAAGATMATHLFNAMSGVHHRDDSLALWVLTDDRVVAGLIADMVHVSAEAVTLAFLAKRGALCLVSDSVGWRAPWAGARGVSVRDGAPRLPDGTLAGSSTSLLGCVRNVVSRCGVDISTALRAATSVPARILGRDDIGVVRVGMPFSAVALDGTHHVSRVWRGLPWERDFTTLR